MKNLFYYIKKFGSLSFDKFPFNEVDSLILSQLSYLNLEHFVPELKQKAQAVRLKNIIRKQENILTLCKETLDERRNIKLLRLMQKTSRFDDMMLNYYANQFNVEKVEQFCAVTFIFPHFLYVAFRGTDLTLLGWKENFSMSFLDVIPSQADASLYLEKIAQYEEKDFYVGGHSKGGNLAVYASLYATKEIRDRILIIYDHDGPGFQVDIFSKRQYKDIEHKIDKTSCKEALVGILLYHSEKIRFVNSRSVGIFQHDPYNWEITKNGRFKLIKRSNLVSKVFEKTVSEFIEVTSIEDRRRFLDITFKILMEHHNSTIFDIKRHPIKYFFGMKKRYALLSLQERKLFKKILKRYRILWKHNFKFYLKRKIHFKDRV
ncbi:MAG: DUF2974 domain-containing protein [Anaeroplasmataceae bacterium]|nr:DUF2974 domain-containing protein [Anaeroplasmataceae bacterium]